MYGFCIKFELWIIFNLSVGRSVDKFQLEVSRSEAEKYPKVSPPWWQMCPCLDGKQPTNGPCRLSIYNYRPHYNSINTFVLF